MKEYLIDGADSTNSVFKNPADKIKYVAFLKYEYDYYYIAKSGSGELYFDGEHVSFSSKVGNPLMPVMLTQWTILKCKEGEMVLIGEGPLTGKIYKMTLTEH